MNARVNLPMVLLATLVAGGVPTQALAQEPVPTRVMIRVVANDAKLIGSGVGGARITVRDVRHGTVLAEGVQEGRTGNTRAIIVEPHVRHAPIYDTEGAAGFLATLPLVEPTVVEIAAEGPLGTPDDLRRATRTMLLVPGQDVLGDGVVLALQGLTVELNAPHGQTPEIPAGQPLDVRARVTMLCGCPTEPGGLWDAADIRIEARLLQRGRVVASVPLTFTGQTSHYGGSMSTPTAGEYVLEVLAMDPTHGNFGRVRRLVQIRSGR